MPKAPQVGQQLEPQEQATQGRDDVVRRVQAREKERDDEGGIKETQGGQFHCVPGVADVVPKAACLVGPYLLEGEGHGVEEEEDPPDEGGAVEAPGAGMEGKRHEVGHE